MKLQIVARQLPLTPALREHIRHHFVDMLARHFDRESCELHVELSPGPKHRFFACQARLTVPGGLLVVTERAEDAYMAVCLAERVLLRKVLEWRDRVLIGSRYPRKYFAARRIGAVGVRPIAPAASPEEKEAFEVFET